jgi:hypothetical protein
MGSHVLARQTAQQHKELIFRAFSYNSRRLETLFSLIIEVFYKAISSNAIDRPDSKDILPGSLWGCKRVGEVFARKASGLVREASLLDTFGIGFMNNGVGVGVWTMASWGLYVMPTGDIFWASILATFMCITGIALVWGFLGGSMPRSGGDYIANSRIIHPAVGIAMSMTNAGFIMTM